MGGPARVDKGPKSLEGSRTRILDPEWGINVMIKDLKMDQNEHVSTTPADGQHGRWYSLSNTETQLKLTRDLCPYFPRAIFILYSYPYTGLRPNTIR